MTTVMTQTTLRESLSKRILGLPDKDINLIAKYVEDLEAHEPNDETIRAIQESLNPANLVGPFNSVESLMESLLADDDA